LIRGKTTQDTPGEESRLGKWWGPLPHKIMPFFAQVFEKRCCCGAVLCCCGAVLFLCCCCAAL